MLSPSTSLRAGSAKHLAAFSVMLSEAKHLAAFSRRFLAALGMTPSEVFRPE
jgi:hypothetical protein